MNGRRAAIDPSWRKMQQLPRRPLGQVATVSEFSIVIRVGFAHKGRVIRVTLIGKVNGMNDLSPRRMVRKLLNLLSADNENSYIVE